VARSSPSALPQPVEQLDQNYENETDEGCDITPTGLHVGLLGVHPAADREGCWTPSANEPQRHHLQVALEPRSASPRAPATRELARNAPRLRPGRPAEATQLCRDK
jgi:hypothetical protein